MGPVVLSGMRSGTRARLPADILVATVEDTRAATVEGTELAVVVEIATEVQGNECVRDAKVKAIRSRGRVERCC